MKLVAFSILIIIGVIPAQAQGVDAGRAAAIEVASNSSKKTIQSQEKMQTLMTTGHIWTREEVLEATAFQREFNNYLDNFHDVLAIAAELYGIYYETNKVVKNLDRVKNIINSNSENMLALAVSKRGRLYSDVARQGLDIINDIRKVCFGDSIKLTEKEKMKVLHSIRPKMRTLNKKLTQLAFALQYTSFTDVWNELMGRAAQISREKKKDIIKQARKDWFDNAKYIKVNKKK